MSEQIKVGYCVAYDWHLLRHSLPLIYNEADVICLSLDKDRISWSGNRYDLDTRALYQLVSEIDVKGKVRIVEEDYHLPDLTPMQNEVRQRNRLAEHMGPQGWHIQLDCDEYFIDFPAFVRYLRGLPKKRTKKVNVCCAWVHLYKQLPEGFLFIDPMNKRNLEFMQIATRDPHYEYSRRNGYFNIFTNFRIIHQSWARPRNEVKEKIDNWGHSAEIDRTAYFNFWDSITLSNFQHVKNFHPLKPAVWPSLKYIDSTSVENFVSNFNPGSISSYSRIELFYKNSIFFSRLRSLFT